MKYQLEGYIFRNGENIEDLDDPDDFIRRATEYRVNAIIFSEEYPNRDEDGFEEWLDFTQGYILPGFWYPEITWESEPKIVKVTFELK